MLVLINRVARTMQIADPGRKCHGCYRWYLERRCRHLHPEHHEPECDLHADGGRDRNGLVTLTLTTTGNNNCVAVADQITIDFTPAPVANAGTPVSICVNNPQVTMTGICFRCHGWCMERRSGILHAEQHDAERSLHADPCGTRSGHVDADLDDHRQQQLQRRHQHTHDHLHASSCCGCRCERNRLRERFADHLERIGERCHRCDLERRCGGLHAEQHDAERDLPADRCRTQCRNGDTHADLCRQRQLQRGERSGDLQHHACTNGECWCGSIALREQRQLRR